MLNLPSLSMLTEHCKEALVLNRASTLLISLFLTVIAAS